MILNKIYFKLLFVSLLAFSCGGDDFEAVSQLYHQNMKDFNSTAKFLLNDTLVTRIRIRNENIFEKLQSFDFNKKVVVDIENFSTGLTFCGIKNTYFENEFEKASQSFLDKCKNNDDSLKTSQLTNSLHFIYNKKIDIVSTDVDKKNLVKFKLGFEYGLCYMEDTLRHEFRKIIPIEFNWYYFEYN